MNVLFRSPMGALLARPWVDGVALAGLRRYLPLSRLWAAANAAGDDAVRFRAEIGAPLAGFWPEPYLRSVLRGNRRARDAGEAARQDWEAAIFGAGGEPGALDGRRRRAATRHLSTRGLFYPLLFPRRAPTARWQIVSPEEAERDLATAAADPVRLYAARREPAPLEISASFTRDGLREYWLRAPTPAARLHARPGSETMYARVVEPADGPTGGVARDTLIFGSGLCLETELLTVASDPARHLAPLGWRVIEPVSPYHGLRAMPGFYGGEPFFARGPTSAIDLIAGQAIESASLIAWARTNFGGRVALAGISMTSFVAQQVASYCHAWAEEARPDAVLLISHSGRVEDVTFGGELAAMLGFDRALTDAGWTREGLARISKLIDPADVPAVPAQRIVSVLGETDRWVPYKDGASLAERWRLPGQNVFTYPLGHLGMPVQLVRDLAPFERLRQVLAEA